MAQEDIDAKDTGAAQYRLWGRFSDNSKTVLVLVSNKEAMRLLKWPCPHSVVCVPARCSGHEVRASEVVQYGQAGVLLLLAYH